MNCENIFNCKKIFIGATLSGIIYVNVILPLIQIDEEKERILKIPTEFSGLYLTNTSSSTSAISFPIIPTFY